MAPAKVGLVGAAGETGNSILNGLIDEGGFVSPITTLLPYLSLT